MKILGIDPGLHATGYGIIDAQNLSYGVIKSKISESLSYRILDIANQLRALIIRERPDRCAVETLFFKKDAARSVILSAHLRGAIFLVLEQEHIPIHEITPAKVKLNLTGNGRASKKQIQYMVGKILGVTGKIGADAADALAVAYSATKIQQ